VFLLAGTRRCVRRGNRLMGPSIAAGHLNARQNMHLETTGDKPQQDAASFSSSMGSERSPIRPDVYIL